MDSVTPIISFIVIAYKAQETHLLRLNLRRLHALKLAENGIPYEIIFVENGPVPSLSRMVKTLFPEVRIIHTEKNMGHPGGNNAGLRVAKGKYLCMVNPDILFTSTQDLKKMITYMDEHADIGILGPRLNNPDGTVQFSCYRKYSRFTPVYRRTFLGKLPFARKDIERHLMVDIDHTVTQDVPWLLGACFLIRKEATDRVGMMDEDFFLYFGDYDWCDRMHDAGFRTVYYADIQSIVHYHQRESASSRFTIMQVLSPVTRIHLKDWMTYLRKHNV